MLPEKEKAEATPHVAGLSADKTGSQLAKEADALSKSGTNILQLATGGLGNLEGEQLQLQLPLPATEVDASK